ncbi:dihydrodipicolinate synthase family protein [Pedobacter sp. BS3]|uniref:dihydrodipicolinate synthase family protein n=1 Tax=Pedobacter sp. BS3 TaxID=2567937 RepID=UPI0011EC846C|nr:dihydrodipicolinate synthase family protein [Pedobacter sp. BS3]TZF81094.1 dihydrodipicolinate synthase family protein [Pedobacter sp. BS3]
MKNKQKGFIPVMLTPFKDNGAVDYDGLSRITELNIEAGAAGLFANCLSSEMFELTPQERIDSVKHIVNIADGAVPIVATGTFAGTVAQQADFIKRIYDTGIEAAIVITGLMAEETEPDEIFDNNVFKLIALTPDIPLGFYECPEPYKRLISPAQLKRFVETGRVIYHKDTCLDINLIKEKIEATKDYEQFGLYDAYMVHAVESLKAGSAGLSCIQGNFFPELIVWLCNNYDRPELQQQVVKVQSFITRNMEPMHEVYPIVAKYFLQKRGLNISSFTRRDVGRFTPDVKQRIDVLYNEYYQLRAELNLTFEIA